MSDLSVEFLERYTEVCHGLGRVGTCHPALDVQMWKQFVAECIGGYGDNLAEYRADLWIRRVLQVALDDEILQRCGGFAKFGDLIREIDEQFNEIATVDLPIAEPKGSGTGWWSLVVPRYGGEELARDLREELGVVISIQE